MSLSREILSPVTTAGMLYPALHTLVSQIAMPNMVSRQFLQQYSLTASNSVTFPKQSGSPGAVINKVAEGVEIPLDVTAYNSVNVVPYKVAHGFIITRETIEDSLIPIQQDQLARSSLRVANKVDKDCIDAIQTGRSGSAAATGKSLATNGAEFVMSGSGGPGIGMYDIIGGKALIENNNYVPDTLLVHPRSKVFIERLPHFTALAYYGEPKMQEGFIATPGKFGDILGLDAYSSTNCPTGSAFVLSRGRTTNILGQYSPLGFFVERRALTTAVKPLEERDSIGVYVTMRYAPTVIRGEAGAEITGINVT
jgi:hypothetical protein